MPREVERKFLLKDDAWKNLGEAVLIRQGYLSTDPGRTVRVRVIGPAAYLTVKGPSTGVSRAEFEYPIPMDDAVEMLETLCRQPIIEKHRTRIPIGGVVWEVDEFHGLNQGLVLAEVELESPDQAVDLPDWVGEEVSDDPRYFNAGLVEHPYSEW